MKTSHKFGLILVGLVALVIIIVLYNYINVIVEYNKAGDWRFFKKTDKKTEEVSFMVEAQSIQKNINVLLSCDKNYKKRGIYLSFSFPHKIHKKSLKTKKFLLRIGKSKADVYTWAWTGDALYIAEVLFDNIPDHPKLAKNVEKKVRPLVPLVREGKRVNPLLNRLEKENGRLIIVIDDDIHVFSDKKRGRAISKFRRECRDTFG